MCKKYQIIYSDPPWSYYNDMTVDQNCTTVRGMRRPPYPVMSTQDICNLNVESIADDNCILFIWTTDCHLEKCMRVIKAWGFEYKTVGFLWRKTSPKTGRGISFMGAYTKKSGCELCLIATRGKNAHKLVKNHKVDSYIESPRQEHSKKPDGIRKRIVDLLGDLPRVELFARQVIDGWDCWGNEVKTDIQIEQKESAFVHNKIEFPEFNDHLLEEFDKQFFENGQDDDLTETALEQKDVK